MTEKEDDVVMEALEWAIWELHGRAQWAEGQDQADYKQRETALLKLFGEMEK